MAQSYGAVYLHIVYSTKHREKLLSKETLTEYSRYITPILKEHRAKLITSGGMPDHVHMLIDLGREVSVSTILREIKSKSSAWLRQQTGKGFSWQAGYGVFSVSATNVPGVVRYIANQEEHHRHKSFQEEFEEMLEAVGIEFDPKYLWQAEAARNTALSGLRGVGRAANPGFR